MTSRDETVDVLQRRVDQLVAREEIRDVLYRYARGIDRADEALLKSCYFPDAIDAHSGSFVGPAHEFAEEMLSTRQLGQLRDYRHYITNSLIELDGERAYVESSFLCTLEVSLAEEGYADAQSEGRYFDIFEQREGEWKIWRRLMISEKMVWRVRPDQPSNSKPTHSHTTKYPDDPVYQRFDLPSVLPPEFRSDVDPWAFVRGYFETRA